MAHTDVDNWLAIDVPAFKPEPYINSGENYLTRFEFELLQINSTTYNKKFTTEWKDVTTILNDYSGFGDILSTSSSVISRMADAIDLPQLTAEEKLKRAVDTMHAIKYDGRRRLTASNAALKFQYEEGVGSSADINLGLIVLLDKLDFEVYPVVLSTRDNGLLFMDSPSLNKLNYVVAMVKLNGQFVLVDATEKYLPYNLLPLRCLNQNGRIIDKDTIAPVDIIPQGKDKKMVIRDLTLTDDLTLEGKVTNAYYDYAAYNKRNEYFGYADEEAYLNDQYNENMIINEAVISDAGDVYKPFKEEFSVEITNEVMDGGDMVYINVMPFDKQTSNPFNNSERLYPIDFGYGIERSGTIAITIPDHMEVVEKPENMIVKTPDNSIDFIYSTTVLSNKFILNFRFRVNNPIIYVEQYESIQRIYEMIIEKEAEPLILKFKS